MAVQKLGKRNGVISKKPKKSEFYTFDGETLIIDTGEFVFELENYSKDYQKILDNIDKNEKGFCTIVKQKYDFKCLYQRR